jgi:HEAT repeat protein
MLGLPQLPRTLDAALRDAEHQREHVRKSALGDLVRLTREPEPRARAVRGIERLLRNDPSAALRADAALALADAEAQESRDALVAALGDANLAVRQFAILALGELGEVGDAELAKRLVELGGAAEPALRFQALVALERIAPERIDRLLEQAVADSDPEVQAMAFRIAERRFPGGPSGSAAPAWLREKARSALAAPSAGVRAAAAFVLAAQRDPAAHPLIVGILDGSVASSDEDLQGAIELAVTLGLKEARRPLERRAFGVFGIRTNPIAWHACVALARLGDARARESILKRLSAWRYDARTLAVAAAGQAQLVEARPLLEAFRADPARAAPEAVAEALRALDAGD